MSVRIIASVTNWARIAVRGAPMALRIPISRVRSVTVTSMMFITPIPPTSSEIAATAPSRIVNVSLVSWLVCRRLPWLRTLNGVVAPAEIPWRESRIVTISACAASSAPPDDASTTTCW